jgi:hypothetical protein
MQEQASTTKDAPSNPQEGNVMGSMRPAAPEVEETYADLKQDLSLFQPILSTAPGSGLHPWVDQWTSPPHAGPQIPKNNVKDDILAIKPKSCLISPPVLPAPQCKDQFFEFPQGKSDNVWALNLPLPMKVQVECNDGKKAAVEDDEDDSDQIFRDLSAYMYDML